MSRLNSSPSSERRQRRALDLTNDQATACFDRAVKRIFESSLTLASVLNRPSIDDHTRELLGGVIAELDHTVTELRSAAFEIAVRDGDPATGPQHRPTPLLATTRQELADAYDRDTRTRLRRIADNEVFAYAAPGNGFVRASDHIMWAYERDLLLWSARSGTPLARRVGDVFYDLDSNLPLYYDESQTDPADHQAANTPPFVDGSRTLGEVTT
jgi:hypothetical protein